MKIIHKKYKYSRTALFKALYVLMSEGSLEERIWALDMWEKGGFDKFINKPVKVV